MKPSDFLSFPAGSIFGRCEYEIVAQNIMSVLTRTGNEFKPLNFQEYKKERLKDKDFSEDEKFFFDNVIEFCESPEKAKTFCSVWYLGENNLYN